jgi:hypothetical protein
MEVDFAPKRMSSTEHYPGCQLDVDFRGRKPGRNSATMEHCYLVSISMLEQILQSQAEKDTRYSFVAGEDTVTVVHYGPVGLIDQFAFPVVYRIADVPEDEGTMMLMVATERSRECASFWVPLEKMLHDCSTSPAA